MGEPTIHSTRGLRLAFRAGLTQCKVGFSVVLGLVTNQTEHTSHHISHHHLSRLGGYQPSSHALDPLDQLRCVRRSAGRNDAEEKVSGCRGA